MVLIGVALFSALLVCGVVVGQPEEEAALAHSAGVFPDARVLAKWKPNGCLRNYWYCPNQCTRNGQKCCWCEECWNGVFGLTQTCTCCPKNYKCCPGPNVAPKFGQPQTCCPLNSKCGFSGGCTRNGLSVRPLYQQPTSQNCYRWIWPPRDVVVLADADFSEDS